MLPDNEVFAREQQAHQRRQQRILDVLMGVRATVGDTAADYQAAALRFNRPAQFECELPPEVRAEFKRVKKAPRKKPAYGLALLIASVAGFLLLNHQRTAPGPQTSPESFKFDPADIVPTPSLPPLTPAPKAELFRIIPRAQLVRYPWKRGQTVRLMMPYHLGVQTRYLGLCSSIHQLPAKGNKIGDMYVVGTTPWIWLTQPGTSTPVWVDP